MFGNKLERGSDPLYRVARKVGGFFINSGSLGRRVRLSSDAYECPEASTIERLTQYEQVYSFQIYLAAE